MSIAILLAAVVDDRWSSLLPDSIVVTYRSIVESKSYRLELAWFLPGIPKHFDLTDPVGTLAFRPCWLLNATNAKDEPLPELKLSAIYRDVLEIYSQSGASEGLNLLVQSAD